MATIQTVTGESVTAGRRLLSQLRAMSDAQVRDCGYEPASVRAAQADAAATLRAALAARRPVAVQVVIRGEVAWWGLAEYVTADGYVGVRDASSPGRVDEVAAEHVVIDPT